MLSNNAITIYLQVEDMQTLKYGVENVHNVNIMLLYKPMCNRK